MKINVWLNESWAKPMVREGWSNGGLHSWISFGKVDIGLPMWLQLFTSRRG